MFIPMVHAQNRSILRPPIVTTLGYSLEDRLEITMTYDFIIKVDSIEGSNILTKGIIISENSDFSTIDFTLSSSGGIIGNEYTFNLKMANFRAVDYDDTPSANDLYGLKYNTQYYYKAFATDENGTGFGDVISFMSTKGLYYFSVDFNSSAGSYGQLEFYVHETYWVPPRYISPFIFYVSETPNPANWENELSFVLGFYELYRINSPFPNPETWKLSSGDLVVGRTYYVRGLAHSDLSQGSGEQPGGRINWSENIHEFVYAY